MTLRLDRLQPANFNARGMQTLWQRHCEQLEAANVSLQSQITAIAAAQAAATAAQASADAASTEAVAAAREAARIASYPNPGVGILSATDAGSNVTVAVAGHTRVYPVQGSIDVPDVAITGASITALSYSTLYYIYYDDTTLAVAAPTFVATTSAATAQVGAATGRHFLGSVTTPAAGGGATSGSGGSPPGGGGNPIP